MRQPDSLERVVGQSLDAPVAPVQDRNEVKWQCENQLAETTNFSTILWKVEFSNVGQLHCDLRLVMPLQFQFQDADGSALVPTAVALRQDCREIFSQVRITLNGQLFSLEPRQFEHLQFVAVPASRAGEADIDSRLPIQSKQIDALYNKGFSRRASELARSRVYEAEDADFAAGARYKKDVELRISHLVWKDWLRKGEINTQKGANLFEALIEVQFRQDVCSADTALGASRQNAIWAHAFDIESDLCYATQQQKEWAECKDAEIVNPVVRLPSLSTGAQQDAFYRSGNTRILAAVANTGYFDTDVPIAEKETVLYHLIQTANVGGNDDDNTLTKAQDVAAGTHLFFVHSVQEYGAGLCRIFVEGSDPAVVIARIAHNPWFRVLTDFLTVPNSAAQFRSGDPITIRRHGQADIATHVWKAYGDRLWVRGDLPGLVNGAYDISAGGVAPHVVAGTFRGEILNDWAKYGVISRQGATWPDREQPAGVDDTGDLDAIAATDLFVAGAQRSYQPGETVHVSLLTDESPAPLDLGFLIVKSQNANGVKLIGNFSAYGDAINAALPAMAASARAQTLANQSNHIGGGAVAIRKVAPARRPVARCVARWTDHPYLRWERVKGKQPLADAYTYQFTQTEIYERQTTLQSGGRKDAARRTQVRFEDLRVLSGWSRMFIYCSLDPTSGRSFEWWTALRQQLPSILGLRVRINEKYSLKGTESREWLYRRYKETTASKATFAEWDRQFCVIALKPEHLAYDQFFAGAAKLTSMGIDFDVAQCEAIDNVRSKALQTTTTVNRADLEAADRISPFASSAAVQRFIDEAQWRVRVVFEYSRKQARFGADGSVNINDNLQQQPRDGLTLATAVPRPIKVAGPHLDAYKL